MFTRFAEWWVTTIGRPLAFTLALGACVVWLAMGPAFGWSNAWQLVINTGTTIVTWLMLFLLQHSQNRDTESLHAKMDQMMLDLPEVDETAVGEKIGGERVNN